MKKNVQTTLATCVLLTCVSQTSFATVDRVNALGGETAMLSDDDTNIDLFPQSINKQSLFRLSNISSATPDYAIVTGEEGKKWGLYGGTDEQNDFLNIYRSLDKNSAVKLGFSIGRYSEEDSTNNNEATPLNSKSTEKNSYFNLKVDGAYGINKGDSEMSIQGFFAYGPNTVAAISTAGTALTGPFGTYQSSGTTNATTTKASGSGNTFSFGARANIRKPMNISIFNKVFASGVAVYGSDSSSLSTGIIKNEDISSTSLFLSGRVLMFNEKKISEKSRVIYGIGGEGFIFKASSKDAVTSDDTSVTQINFSGPQIRLGAETNLKYGVVRFGIQRDFTLLNYISSSQTPNPGASVNDKDSQSLFDIATSGSYAVSTGFGVSYNDLQIDFALNRQFWVTGPQMIIAGTGGALAGSASMIYKFK